MSRLKSLDLFATSVTGPGLRYLRGMFALEDLNVAPPAVSGRAKRELREYLPNLRM
jgi:hypothetical protein